MEERITALADLLLESGQAHHHAYAATNGDDPDWPIWYADYLYGKLPAHLGITLEKNHLADILSQLNVQYKAEAPQTDWTRYYAQSLLAQYGTV